MSTSDSVMLPPPVPCTTVPPGVGDIHLPERDVDGIRNHNGIVGGLLDRPAGAIAVVEAARLSPVSSHREEPRRTGRCSARCTLVGAVGRDALKCQTACPMVVLATFSAVPVVVLMVLVEPVTVTVPPPVALKPAPLVVVTASEPPVKLIVAPVLVARLTAAPAPVLMTWLALGKRDRAAGDVLHRDAGAAGDVQRAGEGDVVGGVSVDVDRAAAVAGDAVGDADRGVAAADHHIGAVGRR